MTKDCLLVKVSGMKISDNGRTDLVSDQKRGFHFITLIIKFILYRRNPSPIHRSHKMRKSKYVPEGLFFWNQGEKAGLQSNLLHTCISFSKTSKNKSGYIPWRNLCMALPFWSLRSTSSYHLTLFDFSNTFLLIQC